MCSAASLVTRISLTACLLCSVLYVIVYIITIFHRNPGDTAISILQLETIRPRSDVTLQGHSASKRRDVGLHPSQLGFPAPALFPILSSPSRVEASVNHLFKIPSPSVALDQHQARSCASRVKLFPPLIIGIIFVSCLVAPFLFSIAERLPPGHGSWLQLLSALQDLFSAATPSLTILLHVYTFSSLLQNSPCPSP